ncbi:MAG TPA: DUF1329 domain-containing protein [Burkholderiaceae bacterium]|nr:DUF1329 domain-containing protein [Burkholderiaceae bacterium]
MQASTLRCVLAPVAAAIMALGSSAFAAELPEGTVISKDNIDKIKNDTFMGHKIGDLLTEKMEWFVRTYNKKYPLTKSREPVLDPKYTEATNKYSGQVKFDPQTREVTGYVAGQPFPNISASDPYAGDKVVWNFYLGAATGSDIYNNPVNFITSNKNGFEASQKWTYQRIMAKGRLWGDAPFPNEGDVFNKTVLVGLYPQDVKGVGTFSVQYDKAGKLDDVWAYIKSARRVRRLSGNSWTDPVGGFDFINDDVGVWNSRPSRYKSIKLIGKRWILASTDFKAVQVKGKEGTGEEWANLNFKDAPYVMSEQKMTPREVWVVEGIPPDDHPYGKKVVYIDTKLPAIYHGEVFDKKGQFWRFQTFFFNTLIGEKSKLKYYATTGGEYIDFKAMHGTFWNTNTRVDVGLNPTKHTVDKLETMQ